MLSERAGPSVFQNERGAVLSTSKEEEYCLAIADFCKPHKAKYPPAH